jgi:hypothetical protein
MAAYARVAFYTEILEAADLHKALDPRYGDLRGPWEAL